MFPRIVLVAFVSTLLADCTHAATSALPLAGAPGPNRYVLQGGGLPLNFTRFSLNSYTGVYSGIIKGADGAMWFTDFNGAGLVRIAMDGAYTELPLSLGFGNPTAIKPAPGGKFFILRCNGGLTVADMHGGSTDYPLPVGQVDCGPTGMDGGLAEGPDGNAWTTGLDDLFRVTPSGAVTSFPFPGGRQIFGGQGVTSGPNKLVWFLDTAQNSVDSIDPNTETITPYPVDRSCPLIGALVASHGNLWFGCNSVREIGEMTPAGAVTFFPSNSDFGGSILSATQGPDGDPWFVLGSSVVRINSSNGVQTSFQSHYQDPTFAIATGPDRNLWVTTNDGRIIVYIRDVLTVSPTSLNFSSPQLTATITGKETGKPTLTASSSNVGVASVTPGQQQNTFVVESLAVGECTITVQDSKGNSFNVPVTVQ